MPSSVAISILVRPVAGMTTSRSRAPGWEGQRLGLRFPVYSRNRFNHTFANAYDYDLLIYVANWPSPRHFAWQTLLKARAIENLAYVVGVNRVGMDGNDLHYLGGSTVHGFLGNTLLESGAEPQMQTTSISFAQLQEFRERFPVHMDADSFEINID